MSAPHPRTMRTGSGLRLLRAAVFAAVCVVLAACGHALASCATVPLWTLGAGFLGALAVVAPLAGRERSLAGITALLAAGQTVLHVLFGLGQHGVMGSASASGAMNMNSMMSMGSTGSTAGSLSDAALIQQAAHILCGGTASALSPAQAQRILADARLYPGTGTGTATGTTVVHDPADALSTAAGSLASLLPSLPMLLGHALAALAVGWLLRRGDSAVLRLVELSAQGVTEGALVRSLGNALALVRALLAGLPVAPEAGPRPPRTDAPARPEPRTAALQHSVIRRGPPAATALALAA
ncbi:hypothetical protein [Streptomyces sp. NPDC059378]|uniref:hypothetical protein n=1 Tax=Streptomyces sp. NPDC059378 TaxID=3346815 RepID=UPI0036A7BD5A